MAGQKSRTRTRFNWRRCNDGSLDFYSFQLKQHFEIGVFIRSLECEKGFQSQAPPTVNFLTQICKVALFILAGVSLSGCFPSHFKGKPYEGSYSGIRKRWNQTTNNAALRVIMVHGMSGFGAIEPGYGDDLARSMAKKFGLSEESACVTNKLPSSIGVTNILRVCNFTNESQDRLAVYELTWSSMTINKKAMQFAKDSQMNKNRLWANKKIKGLVDSGFGDAMIYLNPTYRTNLQEPILQTLIKVDGEATNENDRIIFITHSLGSKMTLDTILANTNNPAVTNLASKTADIIMLANQIPLLDLGIETNGLNDIPTNSLRKLVHFVGTQKGQKPQRPFLEETRAPSLRVVAATDPNDSLSFPLYPGTNTVNGTVVSTSNIYKYNAWNFLFVVEWPVSAHTDYFINDSLIKKLVEGFPKKGGKN